MTWTSEKDEALCKEILLLEPFRFRPRTKGVELHGHRLQRI